MRAARFVVQSAFTRDEARTLKNVTFRVERAIDTDSRNPLAIARVGSNLELRAGTVYFRLKIHSKDDGWFFRMGFAGATAGGELPPDSMSICAVGKDGLFDSIQVSMYSNIRMGDRLVSVVNKREIPDSEAFQKEPTRIQSYWVQSGEWGRAIEQGFGSKASKLEFNNRNLFSAIH